MEAIANFIKRLKWRFVWSWAGISDAWTEQQSFRNWVWINAISVALAFLLPLTAGERALVLALGLVLLAVELINTAIEYTIDYISTERHPLAGRAKDAGSAAVFLTSLGGAVAWGMILWRVFVSA